MYTISKGILNTTPQVEDLKEPPTLIVQAPDVFALVDSGGIHIYSYEGRRFSTIKYPGMRVEFFNEKTISVARDMVAVIDSTTCHVRLFDVHGGKQTQLLEHKQEVLQVALNQQGGGRRIALLDKNKDLYLCPSHKVHMPLPSR